MNEHLLITLVETHKCLYDKSSNDWKDVNKKKLIWQSIADQLNTSVDVCTKRWTQLRERFNKELRLMNMPSGSGAALRQEWSHFSELQFLRSHVQHRRQRSNFQKPSNEPALNSTQMLMDCTDDFSQMDELSGASFSCATLPTASTPTTSTPTASTPTSPSPTSPFRFAPSSAASSAIAERKQYIDETFQEVATSLKEYLNKPKNVPKNPMAHSFAQFVEHTLEEMEPEVFHSKCPRSVPECFVADNLIGSDLIQINHYSNSHDKLLDLIFICSNLNFNISSFPLSVLPCDSHHTPIDLTIDSITFDNVPMTPIVNKHDFLNCNSLSLANDLKADYRSLKNLNLNFIISCSNQTYGKQCCRYLSLSLRKMGRRRVFPVVSYDFY